MIGLAVHTLSLVCLNFRAIIHIDETNRDTKSTCGCHWRRLYHPVQTSSSCGAGTSARRPQYERKKVLAVCTIREETLSRVWLDCLTLLAQGNYVRIILLPISDFFFCSHCHCRQGVRRPDRGDTHEPTLWEHEDIVPGGGGGDEGLRGWRGACPRQCENLVNDFKGLSESQ